MNGKCLTSQRKGGAYIAGDMNVYDPEAGLQVCLGARLVLERYSSIDQIWLLATDSRHRYT